MGFRKVFGTVYKGSVPWKNAVVRFQLENGSYTPSIQFPRYLQVARANELGYVEALLWTNEEGEIPCEYSCTLPDGDSFVFTVPNGDSDLNLSTLRQNDLEPTDPQYQSILAYIEERIGQVSGLISRREVLSPANQPNFSLSLTPVYPEQSDFYINGLKQTYGIDYNINGFILQWLAGYVIPEDWFLEVLYV